MNRLPTPTQFANLGTDQGAVLDVIRREIEYEIDGLLPGGYITVDHRWRSYHLRNARRRMNRLEKLATDFGYWEDR